MFHRRVTVIGGSGFLGRYIVKRLAAEGPVVRVAVRNPDAALFLKPFGPVGRIVPFGTDIRDDALVSAAVAGVDAVVNLPGILHESGRQTFQAIHVDGARRVARCAREAGVSRLVHVSAIGADPASPSAYARTKAAGEAAVLEEFPGATILRPSILIGPEDRFFNRFAAMARHSPVLPLIGGGRTRFQPVYVGDVADAVMAVLRDPATAGRTYELGGPVSYSFRQLMEIMLREIDRRRLLLPLPFGLAMLQAWFLEKLPNPMLTRDQVEMLKRDNCVAEGAAGFADLGIAPKNIEIVLPTYLARFRRGGSFARPGPLKTGE